MIENVFYHEDLVINIDHVNQAIHCGHIEGEAITDRNESMDLTTTESFNFNSTSGNSIVPPKQFGDKSSYHDDTIDSALMESDDQFETGYFDGPFRGNVKIHYLYYIICISGLCEMEFNLLR